MTFKIVFMHELKKKSISTINIFLQQCKVTKEKLVEFPHSEIYSPCLSRANNNNFYFILFVFKFENVLYLPSVIGSSPNRCRQCSIKFN